MALANVVRGEAVAKIGDMDVYIATTMRGLARLSTKLNCATIQDLYARIMGCELQTVYDVLETCTERIVLLDGSEVKGNAAGKAASEAFLLSDIDEIRMAFAHILIAFTRTPKKSAEGNEGKNEASVAATE